MLYNTLKSKLHFRIRVFNRTLNMTRIVSEICCVNAVEFKS